MDEFTKYLKTMTIPMIIAVVMLFWYRLAESFFEKILIAFIFATILIPFGLGLLNFLLVSTAKPNKPKDKSNNEAINKTNISKSKKVPSEKPTTKGKINPSQFYPRLRDVLIKSSKNQLINRKDILFIKDQVDEKLGEHKQVYKSFTFENDLHEIYIKIKSKSLKDEDYKSLIKIVNGVVTKKENMIELINYKDKSQNT